MIRHLVVHRFGMRMRRVNATLVEKQITVNAKYHLNRAIFFDFFHDIRLIEYTNEKFQIIFLFKLLFAYIYCKY